ncbi:MAG: anhydro-N-acetylmuramic acid kinase [Anaerolineae bacterium]
MRIIGLMSGTSADGIDAALCEITGAPPDISARILAAHSQPYPATLQDRILRQIQPETSRVDELSELNALLGEAFAQAALALLAAHDLTPDEVDLIGSHGQTVWHMVQPDGRVTSTLQIAEASVIAERTGITTISNFRARDVAAGGQGAPLTSYADWLLLRHPDHWRAVQNLGGIANVTFLPPRSESAHPPLSFDTGPANCLIDGIVTLLTDGAAHFDRDGALAAQGRVDAGWLAELLAHPYYTRKPPKTTGRELFSPAMAADLLATGRQRGLADADIVATVTALTAASIADAYRRFAPAPIREVIVGGGGGRNPTLMRMLRERLAGIPVRTHEDIGLDSDNKEALVFALLAHETWHARPGNHPALTGARRPVVLGQITPGANYPALARRTWGQGGR